MNNAHTITYKNARYEKGLFINNVRVTIPQIRYIATIWAVRGKYGKEFKLTTTIIADQIGVETHSASEMLKKLTELGYVVNLSPSAFLKSGSNNWDLSPVGQSLNLAALQGINLGKI